jgi:hypothetical protein
LVFGGESELDVLVDYCIYDHQELPSGTGKRTAIGRYLAFSRPPVDPDDVLVLHACAQARYCLLSIEKPVPGIGAEVTDLLRRYSFLLTDVGLSKTARVGLLIATRVVAPGGIQMTTGAAFAAARPADGVRRVRCDRVRGGRALQHKDVDAFPPHLKARMSAAIIRSCLAHDAASHITFEPDARVGEIG